MSKLVLGSGLIGLMAKDILGDSWDIVPQGISRYYSWPVALADNFLPVSPKNDFRTILTPDTTIIKRAFSLGGQLIFAPLKWVSDIYTDKVYGEPIPVFNQVVEMEQMVSTKSCSLVYGDLLAKHIEVLTERNDKYGKITKIVKGEVHTTKTVIPYDRIISTIPLDALLKFIGKDPAPLKSRDVWVYHIRTSQLDFEGATQVLVADKEFDFYKVNKIGPSDYIFFCLNEIVTPIQYFGAFTNDRVEIVNSSKCSSFIPLSLPPDLTWLENDYNIKCIGSHAEWDALADVGSCLVRILRI